ncbi:MAG: hypothetical protein ABSB52_15580 [Acidimicrobiales bacterium]
MTLKTLRRVLLTAGVGAMLVAMVGVVPAAATSGVTGQGYTWTNIKVPGSYATFPVMVNNKGVVVGAYYVTSTDWKNGVQRGFIKQGRKYTTIDDPLGVSNTVTGMNDHGEIVGTYTDSSGADYGFIDQGGRFATIADPSADNAKDLGTNVDGVTDSGEIGGTYFDSHSTMHAFSYKKGSYMTYNCPGQGTGRDPTNIFNGVAGSSFGYVANAGAMSGTCFEDGTGYYNYVNQDGRFNRVPNYPGSSDSFISWVNDSGESGGVYYTTPTAANGGVPDGYIYQKGKFTTINDPDGQYGLWLNGANDSGLIVGAYYDGLGFWDGFELTPTH